MVWLCLLVVIALTLNTRSKLGRIDYRLGLLEEAVRTRLRATPGDLLYDRSTIDAAEPVAESVEPSKPAAFVEPEPLVMPQPISVPEPIAAAMRAQQVKSLVIEPADTPAEPDYEPEPAPVSRSLSVNFEDLFGRRLPIWAGGITLVIAGVLIVKYAVDLGLMKLFTPWVRVIAGLMFGGSLIGGAEFAMRNAERVADPRVQQALSGAGIATLYASILIAANVYALIGPFAAIVALTAVTAGALALSIRFGAPCALLGLAGGLAAPALVGGIEPNVPLLAGYLALTIAGLAGVSRMQRWAWLGLSALVGGMGWSLWIMLASSALDTVAALSLGGYVLLIAVAVPLLVFEGPRAALLRAAAAVVGAAQLALLIALGGFTIVNWGLFIALAVAGQWLNRREDGFAIVPTTSLALSALLLTIWPSEPGVTYAVVGGLLVLVHALTLLERLWRAPRVLQHSVELCATAAAAFAIPLVKFYAPERETMLALVALATTLLPATALVQGWSRADRQDDPRFAWLTATLVSLLGAATILVFEAWLWPVAIVTLAVATLFFAHKADDPRAENVAAIAAGASLLLLVATGLHEMRHLTSGATELVDGHALLRWGIVGAGFAAFTARAHQPLLRTSAAALTAALGYGLIAQIAPLWALPLIASALAVLPLRDRAAQSGAVWATLAITATWALLPLGVWMKDALLSLVGMPMTIDPDMLDASATLRRLAIPAAVTGTMLTLRPTLFAAQTRLLVAALAAIVGGVAAHVFFRLGFEIFGNEGFITTGLAQRLVWSALLIGAGMLLARRLSAKPFAIGLIGAGAAHLFWYSLVLHNPLWAAQAVGRIPLVNLITMLFALAGAALYALNRQIPALAGRPRLFQPAIMLLVIGFTWATLRQAFHGTLLVAPGVDDAEDILRSILAIALAVGFLVWGIRRQQRDWRMASLVLMLGAVGKVFLFDASGLQGLMRIGSFVALGFSLIGIGWLYSRQLSRDEATPR